MRIKSVILLVIAFLAQQCISCCAAEADIVKSYYLLKYEYKDFINPLLYAGASEKQVIAFLKDVEENLQDVEDLNEDNFESYFKRAVRYAVAKKENLTVTQAIVDVYGDSIDEYSETGQIPKKLQNVYNAVLEVLFRNGFKEKAELAAIYEKYKAEFDDGFSEYTDSSVLAFSEALDAAGVVLGNVSAQDGEINKALNDLIAAYNALEKKQNSGSGSSGGGSASSQGGTQPIPQEKSFKDFSSSHWSYNAVKALTDKGIISGFEDNTFRPEQFVTREQFAKIICAAFGLKDFVAQTAYRDAIPGVWYNDYVYAVTNSGLMLGVGDDCFGIGQTLSRQDLVVIVYRIVNSGMVNREFEQKTDLAVFADLDEASDYAVEAITEMQKIGIINGVGEGMFAPKKGVTRSEAAQIIYNLISI